MKLRRLRQDLMLFVAVLLLIAAVATGIPIETENTTAQGFLWLIILLICVGAAAFRISEKTRPLDWLIIGSLLGAIICLSIVLGGTDGSFAARLKLCLLLLELLLSVSYRICRWFGIFI